MPSPLALVMLLATVVSVGIAIYAWDRGALPGTRWFVLVMCTAALWTGAYTVALLTFEPGLRRALEIPAWIGRSYIPVAWIAFALAYTGRGELVTRRTVAVLAALPTASIVVVATNVGGLAWSNYEIVATLGAATAVYDKGPWIFLQATYAYLLVGVGVMLILELAIIDRRLYTGQVVALLAGSLVPTLLNVAWLFEAGPMPAFDASAASFTVTGACFGYALFRRDLFSLVPATRQIGRRTVLEDIGAAVVIVDQTGRIVDLNGSASELFDVPDGVVDRQFEAVVDADIGPGESGLVTLGARRFDVTGTPVRDRHDRTVGHTVVFHDVTDQVNRRQRLEVLNRVLRHNLRNQMTAIHGYASLLADRSGAESPDELHRIERNAESLMAVGETAREADRLLDRDVVLEPVAVAPRIDEAVEAATTDGAEIRTSADAGRSVTSDPDAVETAVRALIECLCGRDCGATTLVILAAPSVEGVEVRVTADVEPPKLDREAVESGSETPLNHGKGLRLWLAEWAARSVGGGLAFDDDGVIVNIPDLADRRPAGADGSEGPAGGSATLADGAGARTRGAGAGTHGAGGHAPAEEEDRPRS
jgi:PAS domain-containing protein